MLFNAFLKEDLCPPPVECTCELDLLKVSWVVQDGIQDLVGSGVWIDVGRVAFSESRWVVLGEESQMQSLNENVKLSGKENIGKEGLMSFQLKING